MTQSPNESDWSTRLAQSIAREVRRHRQEQGLSAQQLSDRCAELGVPIQRTVLANMESGRRTTVTVAEVLVLAAALGVAPGQLMFPVGFQEKVEMLPNQEREPMAALDWVSGKVGFHGRLVGSMTTPIAAHEWHRRNVELLRGSISRRDQLRSQYVEAFESLESHRARRDEVRAELAELEPQIVEHRERLRGVPLAERPPRTPEDEEFRARVRKLRDEENSLRASIDAARYLKEQLPAEESILVSFGHRLARIRKRMMASGWIPPELPADIADYVNNPPYPDFLDQGLSDGFEEDEDV